MSLGTVLVVEDDDAIRRGLVDALRFSGYTLHEASDGRSGLDLALSIDADIVLLDIMMPRMVRTLAQREAEVLAYLAANPGRAVARDELLARVWGFDPRGTQTRTVDMAIARLREQLDDSPTDPQVIRTVRGKGYMLAESGGVGR